MEPRFGHDFSKVRVHTDTKAAKSARAVNALAYTVGRNVVFGIGQYAPGTAAGQKLLTHELAHVMQQNNQSVLQSKLEIGPADGILEKEADKVAASVLDRVHLNLAQRHHLIQRQPASSHGSLTPWELLPPSASQKIDEIYFNQKIDQGRQSAFRSVYRELVTEDLWNFVDKVDKVITSNVRGIEATSKGDLAARLRSSPYFCRDTNIGGSQHPGEITWRQIVQTATEGLHIGVGHNRMSAHLDVLAPVSGREADGICRYSASAILPHLLQDKYSLRSEELFQTSKTVFDRYNEALKIAQELHKYSLKSSVDRRDFEDANRELNSLTPYIQQQSAHGIPGRREAEQKVGYEVKKIWWALKQIHDRIQDRRLERDTTPF